MKRWFPIWVWPLLLIFSIATVWVRLSVVQLTYDSSETQRQIQAARQAIDQTQLLVAKQFSPRRLEDLAKTRFQLRAPQSQNVQWVKAP